MVRVIASWSLLEIAVSAFLKYRNEEELLATVDDSQRYNDEVIFPDKVRINQYYLHHYSFWMDIKMIFATVLGKRMEYG